mmetsp:Transcript_46289/g.79843  ORF Transcript_46289/g.79843 Transcript_46289/m.79843 type:complete len:357 (-) Transcript_46289:306-1376(-)
MSGCTSTTKLSALDLAVPIHPLRDADLLSNVLSMCSRRTVVLASCVANAWLLARCSYEERSAPVIFCSGARAIISDDGWTLSKRRAEAAAQNSSDSSNCGDEHVDKCSMTESSSMYDDGVGLIGRWLKPDETAHVTLIKPTKGGRKPIQSFTAQPLVGFVAVPAPIITGMGKKEKLRGKKKKKVRRDWLLSFTTDFDSDPSIEPLIEGRLVTDDDDREELCKHVQESGLASTDENGCCEIWETLTLSLRNGQVTISVDDDDHGSNHSDGDSSDDQHKPVLHPKLEPITPPKRNRSLTVTLPSDIGRVAFAVKVRSNARFCPGGVPVKVVAGKVDAPRSLVRLVGNASMVSHNMEQI